MFPVVRGTEAAGALEVLPRWICKVVKSNWLCLGKLRQDSSLSRDVLSYESLEIEPHGLSWHQK